LGKKPCQQQLKKIVFSRWPVGHKADCKQQSVFYPVQAAAGWVSSI
jgi:hypothetical protein